MTGIQKDLAFTEQLLDVSPLVEKLGSLGRVGERLRARNLGDTFSAIDAGYNRLRGATFGIDDLCLQRKIPCLLEIVRIKKLQREARRKKVLD